MIIKARKEDDGFSFGPYHFQFNVTTHMIVSKANKFTILTFKGAGN